MTSAARSAVDLAQVHVDLNECLVFQYSRGFLLFVFLPTCPEVSSPQPSLDWPLRIPSIHLLHTNDRHAQTVPHKLNGR